MKNTTYILTGLALAAVLSAGCGKQETADLGPGTPLSFGTAGEAEAATKADNRATAAVTEFTVTGFEGSKVWFPETPANTSTTYSSYLWRSSVTHTFYAYTNLPASGATASIASTGVTLTYSAVPTAQADQQDILLGSYSGTGDEGKATIQFYHPLTAVSFKVGTISNIAAITGITINGVYASGSVTLGETSGTPDFNWTPGATQDGVNQTINVTDFTSGTALGDPFILIPQTTTSGVTVEMAVTTTGGESRTVSGSLGSINWKHGKNNIYTVDYDGGHALKLSYGISDWGSNTSISADMLDELPAPQNAAVSENTGTSLTFVWDAVTGADSYEAALYKGAEMIEAKTGATTGATFTGLKAGEVYTCSIAAGNGGEYSSNTAVVEVMADPYNGHAYVDLGLPSGIKWATMNVGASTESGNGQYFFWGGTTGYTSIPGNGGFVWANAPFNNGSSSYNASYFNSVKNDVCPNNVLAPEYDAASVKWEGCWRMPTVADFNELKNNTIISKANIGGVDVLKCTSKTDSNKFICFPYTGMGYGSSWSSKGSYGEYWTSNIQSENLERANYFEMQKQNGTISLNGGGSLGRNFGMVIRPVNDK